MEQESYLKSKTIENKSTKQVKVLKEIYNGGVSQKVPSLFGGEDILISPNVAEMGLILLNAISELQDGDNYYYYQHRREVSRLSKRFRKLNASFLDELLWDDEFKPLLEYFYGKQYCEYVISVWNKMHLFMYQSGYDRRSFRAPHLAGWSRVNQVNFLIGLNAEFEYDLTLEEYIVYDHQTGGSGMQWKEFIWAEVLNSGDENALKLMLDIVYQRHKTGKVSRSIIKALLLSDKLEAWKAVEDLLLSAQRQEGLRQTIVECLDETSLGAMKHMIKVILDNKLTRFSSVVRAIDSWAGLGWEAEKQSTVKRFFEIGYNYLMNPELIPAAIKLKDNAEVYMALWAQGVLDVQKCKPLLKDLLAKGGIEKKCLALYFANQTQIFSIEMGLSEIALESENLKIFYWGLRGLLAYNYTSEHLIKGWGKKMFETIEKQLSNIPPKGVTFSGLVFSWLNFELTPSFAYQAMIRVTDSKDQAGIQRLLQYFPKMAVDEREEVTRMILPDYMSYYYHQKPEKGEKKSLSQFQRSFAFSILKDRGTLIRSTAMEALKDARLSDSEIQLFEELLKRKSGDTRKAVINLILKRGETQVIASSERLLAAKTQEQRLAGLDILNQIYSNEKYTTWAKGLAVEYGKRKKITEKELILIRNIVAEESALKKYNLENGFGLYNPSQKSVVKSPQKVKQGEYVERCKSNSFGLSQSPEKINEAIKELHILLETNASYEYEVTYWNEQKEAVILGNSFRQLQYNTKNFTDEEHLNNYPLTNVWVGWFEKTGLTPCDLFLINLYAKVGQYGDRFEKKLGSVKAFNQYVFIPKIPKIGDYDWQNPLYSILEMLPYGFPYAKKKEYLHGLVAQLMASIPKEDLDYIIVDENRWQNQYYTWRDIMAFSRPFTEYSQNAYLMPDTDFKNFWALEYWANATFPKHEEMDYKPQSTLADTARAYQLNLISEDELYCRVMEAGAIRELTTKAPGKNESGYFEPFSFLKDVLNNCRSRILEIELSRGDSATVVTELAENLNFIYGIDNLIKIFKALGKDSFSRGYIYSSSDGFNKKQILSYLIKRCHLSDTDTQSLFNQSIAAANISEKRLVELAVYAQQWIPFVSSYLNWKGLESAIWCLHAHTNSIHNAETETEIAKYSKVTILDFQDGAVDNVWIREAYKKMGKKRWNMLYDAAKYVCDGRGHKRAQLYADVILGKVKITAVTKKVKEKRNQDYLRVYGLVPLSKAHREKDLLKRYQYLQQFKKESKQFGAQKQSSEALAVRIAMDNLARTAGYSDPLRLTWAMEAKEAQQIMEAANILRFDAVEIYLSINDLGKSSILCKKDGKLLSSIPKKLRKEKAVVELKVFNKTLQNQYARTKVSLENAMVNGDVFTQKEVFTLMQHPVVKPMLSKLVLKSGPNLGFIKGEQLQNFDGDKFDLEEEVIIAHCYDLNNQNQWSNYQHYCFEHQVVQPFKQIFRELYLPTADELKEVTISRRYAGHQVQPKQTVALLKSRFWTVDYEEGLQKVFHKEGFIAKIYAMADWFSPADVESPTLETIEFRNRKNGKVIPFKDIDVRIFSEVMRDLDLVVSVAHVGGIDPEVSHSTIEMRAVIVRETCQLFKLKNVNVSKNHVHIEGVLGQYTVHLGSGVCHKVPGRYLSILAVNSQHREKIFLPFIDDDPRSAEVMSKVLLLAKDDEIQDPTVLTQIMDEIHLS